jgi:hypothetical protein
MTKDIIVSTLRVDCNVLFIWVWLPIDTSRRVPLLISRRSAEQWISRYWLTIPAAHMSILFAMNRVHRNKLLVSCIKSQCIHPPRV